MQIARQRAGGQALSVLTVDSPVPDAVLERIGASIAATSLHAIEVVEA